MSSYRPLTEEEINLLEDQSCTAEDWCRITVDEDFCPHHIRDVHFCGDIRLGVFEKNITLTKDVHRHSGIYDATLCNVCVGDDCLIENISGHISNYVIDKDCHISGVYVMETRAEATFAQVNGVSIVSRNGEADVFFCPMLDSQLASLMINYSHEEDFKKKIKNMIRVENDRSAQSWGYIGCNTRIINTSEVVNTNIQEYCEIMGAATLSECTINSSQSSPVYLGSGVICENTIVNYGSSVTDHSRLEDCYVGETCQIKHGVIASAALFFDNCIIAGGEISNSCLGKNTKILRKNATLVHVIAEKLQTDAAINITPLAEPQVERLVSKLHAGIRILPDTTLYGPAIIGAYSTCQGKILEHLDTHIFPFSEIRQYGDKLYLKPARHHLFTHFSAKSKAMDEQETRLSHVDRSLSMMHQWNPLIISQIKKGYDVLKQLISVHGSHDEYYVFKSLHITREDIIDAIKMYEMIILLYLYQAMSQYGITQEDLDTGATNEEWEVLGDLILPGKAIEKLVKDIAEGLFQSVAQIALQLRRIQYEVPQCEKSFVIRLIQDLFVSDNAHPLALAEIINKVRIVTDEWQKHHLSRSEVSTMAH